MKKKIFVLICLLLQTLFSSAADTPGAYRTAGSGNWTSASTWEIYDGVHWVPATSPPDPDLTPYVLILNGHTVTVSSAVQAGQKIWIYPGSPAGKIIISGSLTLKDGPDPDDLLADGQIDLNSGTINGPGSIKVNGIVNCNGGQLDPYNMEIGATGRAYVLNSISLNTTIVNNGIVDWTFGNINFNDGTLTNNGTLNAGSVGNMNNNSGTNQLINNNIINLNPAGTIVYNIPVTNSGQWKVLAGTSQNGNTFDCSGNIDISSGAVFRLNTNTLNINTGSTITGSGSLNQTGGILYLNTDLILSPDLTFNFSSGTGDGTGELTTQHIMNWSGGTVKYKIKNSGYTVVSGSPHLKNSFNNLADCNLTNTVLGCENATIVNNGNFIADMPAGGQINDEGGYNSIYSTANFRKKGAGTLTNNIPTTIQGQFIIEGGTYQIGNATDCSGNIDISSGAIFRINTNTLNFNTGSTITGSGSFNQTGGTTNFNTPVIFPSTITFNLSSGITDGTGLATILGTMNWGGGTVSNPLTMGTGSVLNINNQATIQDVVTNNATVNHIFGNIIFQNGSVINNDTWNETAGASQYVNGSGTNIFDNSGVYIMDKNGDLITDNVPTTNEPGAQWKVVAGSVTYTANFDNYGNLDIASNASMTAGPSSTTNINTGSTFTGTGFIDLRGLVNYNTGATTSVGFLIKHNGGTWQGTGSFNCGGDLDWFSGITAVPTTVVPGGNMNIKPGGIKNLNQNCTVQQGASVYMYDGMIFNTAIMNVNGNLNLSPTTGAPISLTSTGTSGFNFSSTANIANLNLTGVVNNNITGTISGTMSGVGTYNHNASGATGLLITPGFSPGILTINSNDPLLNDNTILQIELFDGSGPGTGHDQLKRNGNLLLDGTLNVVQTGTVPLGTYTIISLTSGTISGSFDVVNIPYEYSLGQTATTVFITKNILPLHLLSFYGSYTGHTTILSWKTANENNTSHFEIERSTDGTSYLMIGNIQAAGNSNIEQNYGFTDKQPVDGNNFYRLKMMDRDGKFTYSDIIKINSRKQFTVRIIPNPATEFITVEGAEKFKTIEIINGTGIVVKRLVSSAYQHPYSVRDLIPGVYFIRLRNEKDTFTERFIKK